MRAWRCLSDEAAQFNRCVIKEVRVNHELRNIKQDKTDGIFWMDREEGETWVRG